jgi:predicted alpha/beta-fold hydrolase
MLGFLFGKQSKNNITSECFVDTAQCCFFPLLVYLIYLLILVALPSEILRVFENKLQRDLKKTVLVKQRKLQNRNIHNSNCSTNADKIKKLAGKSMYQ